MRIIGRRKELNIQRHVVLVSPVVHWNTGNIGRTCLGANAHLHLIKPLGFSLESKEVKRAGLDYWPSVRLSVWENFTHFIKTMKPKDDEILIFSKIGIKPIWSIPILPKLFLIFGSETKGLAESIMSYYHESSYHIPITKQIRSLNLSSAVAIALYESMRNISSFHEWK